MKLHFHLNQVQRLDFFNQDQECIFQTFLQSCAQRMVYLTLNLWEAWGQPNLSPRAHPLLFPDKIKPRCHVSLLFSSSAPCFSCLRLSTLLPSCFPLSVSGRKRSQYEHNKKNQTTLKDLSAKNGVKRRKKKKNLHCVHLLHGGVSLTGCSLCWSALSLSAQTPVPPTAEKGESKWVSN